MDWPIRSHAASRSATTRDHSLSTSAASLNLFILKLKMTREKGVNQLMEIETKNNEPHKI
jgi:hypothetical protein